MTHRQYRAWVEWLGMQWNLPDRHDNYLMQIAAEIRRGNVKEPSKVDSNSMKISFKKIEGDSKDSQTDNSMRSNISSISSTAEQLSEEQIKAKKRKLSEISQALWFARLGVTKEQLMTRKQ